MTSTPRRILLDKNIARSAIGGLRFGARRPLLPVEFEALAVWRAAEQQSPRPQLLIPYTTTHLLQALADYAEVRLLLISTGPLWPGPYVRRWQRRVRESAGLTSEDALIVALGTFGRVPDTSTIGVEWIVTADLHMIHAVTRHRTELERRLAHMTDQLRDLYHVVKLPRVISPDDAMAEWRNSR